MNYRVMILALVVSLMSGAVVSAEQRAVIRLTDKERGMVLHEMRQLLFGVQMIIDGLARDDMPAVAESAKALGMDMATEMSPELKGKLPSEFMLMGRSVHAGFDQLAADTAAKRDRELALTQLATTLQTCVACHDAFAVTLR